MSSWTAAAEHMVERLRARAAIIHPAVARAFRAVPRHAFLPAAMPTGPTPTARLRLRACSNRESVCGNCIHNPPFISSSERSATDSACTYWRKL